MIEFVTIAIGFNNLYFSFARHQDFLKHVRNIIILWRHSGILPIDDIHGQLVFVQRILFNEYEIVRQQIVVERGIFRFRDVDNTGQLDKTIDGARNVKFRIVRLESLEDG